MLAAIGALDAADSGQFQTRRARFRDKGFARHNLRCLFRRLSGQCGRDSVVFLPLDLLAQIGDAIDNALVDLLLNDRGELGDGGGHVLGQHGLEQLLEDGHGTTPKSRRQAAANAGIYTEVSRTLRDFRLRLIEEVLVIGFRRGLGLLYRVRDGVILDEAVVPRNPVPALMSR